MHNKGLINKLYRPIEASNTTSKTLNLLLDDPKHHQLKKIIS